jgi:site-specific recombinase XerC
LEDISSYRLELIRLKNLPTDQGGLSGSTIAHKATQLREFLTWLEKQFPPSKRLQDLASYLQLPKGVTAKRLNERQRDVPSLENAHEMVTRLPTSTLRELRDQAMVAFAFVSGLRAAALTSFRIKHLDLENRSVLQDGQDMRAKNGKCFRVYWFPRTEPLQDIFLNWIEKLKELGFESDDAVFPKHSDLRIKAIRQKTVEPMKSEDAIAGAFLTASNIN